MKKIINFLLVYWQQYKVNRDYKKRMKELRKKDPFIYK
jgi:hypothetical protein